VAIFNGQRNKMTPQVETIELLRPMVVLRMARQLRCCDDVFNHCFSFEGDSEPVFDR
jgi:hypothetical protein